MWLDTSESIELDVGSGIIVRLLGVEDFPLLLDKILVVDPVQLLVTGLWPDVIFSPESLVIRLPVPCEITALSKLRLKLVRFSPNDENTLLRLSLWYISCEYLSSG